MRHPEYAICLPDALAGTPPDVAEQLKTLALAALYLQHLWRTKLSLVLGAVPWIQVSYWRERDLPAPWLLFGEMGLRALQDYEQQRRGLKLNFLDDWETQMYRLFEQEWSAKRHQEYVANQGEHAAREPEQ